MSSACSFCGKTAAEAKRLVGGGGKQARGDLPVVFICDECIGLCHQIVAAEPRKGDLETPEWTPFVSDGRRFEWAVHASRLQQRDVMIVRVIGQEKSVGVVLDDGQVASTELALKTVVRMHEQLE
jgi:hypothetical protein